MKFGTSPSLATIALFGALTLQDRIAAQDTSSGIAISMLQARAVLRARRSGGTFPRSINANGAIIGNYIDANNVSQGFLRSPAGDKFVTFAAPGAGTARVRVPVSNIDACTIFRSICQIESRKPRSGMRSRSAQSRRFICPKMYACTHKV